LEEDMLDLNFEITLENSWRIHNGPCTAIDVHQDSNQIASVGEDGKVAIFSLADTIPSRIIGNDQILKHISKILISKFSPKNRKC
jgi:WD40 repeat protein